MPIYTYTVADFYTPKWLTYLLYTLLVTNSCYNIKHSNSTIYRNKAQSDRESQAHRNHLPPMKNNSRENNR